MSWSRYRALADANPELSSDATARKAFEYYFHNGDFEDNGCGVPLVEQYLPRKIVRQIEGVEKASLQNVAPCPEYALPVKVAGKSELHFRIPWNRCYGAYLESPGWIAIRHGAVDVLLFLWKVDERKYKEAVTFAAVWSDNNKDNSTCKVQIFIPNREAEWAQIYEVRVCSGVLRPLRLPGRTMWRINTDKQFIAFGGEKSGWFDPEVNLPEVADEERRIPVVNPDDAGGEVAAADEERRDSGAAPVLDEEDQDKKEIDDDGDDDGGEQ